MDLTPEAIDFIQAELMRDPSDSDPELRAALCRSLLALPQVQGEPHLRIWLLAELGDSLLRKVNQGIEDPNISEAFTAYQEVETHCRVHGQSHLRAMILTNLANLHLLVNKDRPQESLEAALDCCERALTCLGSEPNDEVLSRVLIHKAITLSVLGERSGDAGGQEEAIGLFEQVLRIAPWETQPESWLEAQNGLARAFIRRKIGPPEENNRRAIAACRSVLRVSSHKSKQNSWAWANFNLALAMARPTVGNYSRRLEKAIRHLQGALLVWQPDTAPAFRADALNLLGSLFIDRIEGNRKKNLETAIVAYRQALQARSRRESPVSWAETRSNLALALALSTRGESDNELEIALETAKEAFQELDIREHGSSWASAALNLAHIYERRRLGDLAKNQEEAIRLLGLALGTISPVESPDLWTKGKNNLGVCFSGYLRGDRAENQETALKHFEEAQELRGKLVRSQEWAETEFNLGLLYTDRHLGKRRDNLEKAIYRLRRAASVYRRKSDPLRWSATEIGLSVAYAFLIQGNRQKNLQQAIEYCRRSLEVRYRSAHPREWAESSYLLGTLLRELSKESGNLEEAISCHLNALEEWTESDSPLDWARAKAQLARTYADLGRLEAAREAFEAALRIFRSGSLPRQHRTTAADLGNLHFDQGRYNAALSLYEEALAAGDFLFQLGGTFEARAEELAGNQDIPVRAAYCLVSLGKASEAIVLLESARARMSAERLSRRTNLEGLSAFEQSEIFEARQALGVLERAGHRLLPVARDQFLEISLRIRELRSRIPPLQKISWIAIAEAALPRRPIVYIVATPSGGLALIVTRRDGLGSSEQPVNPHILWLPLLTTRQLEEWLVVTDNGKVLGGYIHGQFDAPSRLRDELPKLLEGLAMALARPLAAQLREFQAEAIFLVPAGNLPLFPLSATNIGSPCEPIRLSEAFEVVHVPSVRWLLAARDAQLESRSEPRLNFLGIGHSGGSEEIPLAEAEAEAICALFGPDASSPLLGPKATSEALRDHLPGPTHVHFACHGTYDLEDPLESALQLADKPLTMRDLLEGQIFRGVALVTLSACLTGVIDSVHLPDERLDLPSACLEAGAGGVVAALWKVDDLATYLLMKKFYEGALSARTQNEPQLRLATALAASQRWLRNLTVEEFQTHFRPLTKSLERRARKIAIQAIARAFGRRGDERLFEDPYYWASFIYVGA